MLKTRRHKYTQSTLLRIYNNGKWNGNWMEITGSIMIFSEVKLVIIQNMSENHFRSIKIFLLFTRIFMGSRLMVFLSREGWGNHQ